MVMQQELVDDILVPYMAGLSYNIEMGEDTSVDYTDGDITTTNFTDTDPTASTTSNVVVINGGMTSGEGGTDDYNALLITDGTNAVLKALFTEFTKDSSTRVDIQARIAFFVQ